MRLPSLLKSSAGHRALVRPELAHLAVFRPPAPSCRPTRRTAPVLRWAASFSIHLPFWLAISRRAAVGRDAQQPAIVAAADEAVARRIADQCQHRAAMKGPCTGEAASGAASSMSAGSRRTRPSPSAKATVAPSRLKAQAAAGASAATERAGGSVCRHAGFARSSFTAITSGSLRSRASGSRRRGCGR